MKLINSAFIPGLLQESNVPMFIWIVHVSGSIYSRLYTVFMLLLLLSLPNFARQHFCCQSSYSMSIFNDYLYVLKSLFTLLWVWDTLDVIGGSLALPLVAWYQPRKEDWKFHILEGIVHEVTSPDWSWCSVSCFFNITSPSTKHQMKNSSFSSFLSVFSVPLVTIQWAFYSCNICLILYGSNRSWFCIDNNQRESWWVWSNKGNSSQWFIVFNSSCCFSFKATNEHEKDWPHCIALHCTFYKDIIPQVMFIW